MRVARVRQRQLLKQHLLLQVAVQSYYGFDSIGLLNDVYNF